MENNKEIGFEKEIGSFENIPEKKENIPEEKERLNIEEDIKIKSIEEIAGNEKFSLEENGDKAEISKEEKEINTLVKKSLGASIDKIRGTINFVKKKFSPFGIDNYHDKITKRKNDQ